MKSISFFTVLLFAAFPVSAVFAQFGLKAGINFSTIHDNKPFFEDGYSKTLTGAQVGLFYERSISGRFSVQPELFYIQKGGRIETEIFGAPFSAQMRLHFLEVPVLAKISLTKPGQNFRAHLLAGPFASIAVKGRAWEISPLDGQKREYDVTFGSSNDDDYESRFDWGVVGGVAFQWRHFLVDCRYDLGIQKFKNAQLSQLDADRWARLRGFSASVGYVF